MSFSQDEIAILGSNNPTGAKLIELANKMLEGQGAWSLDNMTYVTRVNRIREIVDLAATKGSEDADLYYRLSVAMSGNYKWREASDEALCLKYASRAIALAKPDAPSGWLRVRF